MEKFDTIYEIYIYIYLYTLSAAYRIGEQVLNYELYTNRYKHVDFRQKIENIKDVDIAKQLN